MKFVSDLWEVWKCINDPPAHLSLGCGLGDDDGLAKFGFQIHLVVSVTKELSFNWWCGFAWRSGQRSVKNP